MLLALDSSDSWTRHEPWLSVTDDSRSCTVGVIPTDNMVQFHWSGGRSVSWDGGGDGGGGGGGGGSRGLERGTGVSVVCSPLSVADSVQPPGASLKLIVCVISLRRNQAPGMQLAHFSAWLSTRCYEEFLVQTRDPPACDGEEPYDNQQCPPTLFFHPPPAPALPRTLYPPPPAPLSSTPPQSRAPFTPLPPPPPAVGAPVSSKVRALSPVWAQFYPLANCWPRSAPGSVSASQCRLPPRFRAAPKHPHAAVGALKPAGPYNVHYNVGVCIIPPELQSEGLRDDRCMAAC